jgi:hypothetical protein
VETALLRPLNHVGVGGHLGTNHTQEARHSPVAVTLELLLISIREILVEEVEVGDVVGRESYLLGTGLQIEPGGDLY